MIYAIASGDHVKIGYSVRPYQRLGALQTGSATKCSLIGIMPGTIDDERALHSRFAALRSGGEWFRHEGAVAEFTASMERPKQKRAKEANAVTTLVRRLFRTQSNAAKELGIGQPAVANWVSRGYFSAAAAIEICKYARRAGISMDVTELPVPAWDRGRE